MALTQYTELGDYMFEDERFETFKTWPFNEDSMCNARKVLHKFIFLCLRLYSN